MHNSQGIKGVINLNFNDANRLLMALKKAGLEESSAFRKVHRKVREIVDFHLYKNVAYRIDAKDYWCNKKLSEGLRRSKVGPFFPLPPVLVYELRKYLVFGDVARIADENNWNYDTVRRCLDLKSVIKNDFGALKVSVRDAPKNYPLRVINQLLKTAENNRRHKKYLRKRAIRLRVYIEKHLKPFYHEFEFIEPYVPGTPRQLAKAHKASVKEKYKAGLFRGEVPVQG